MRWVVCGAACLIPTVAAAGNDETCRRAPDRADRVAACTQVIGTSNDRKTLLRAHNTRGLALCDLKRCPEAVADFEYVVRADPSIAGYFDNYARALRDAGRLADSLRAASHAVEMAPTYAFTYYGKAKTLEVAGESSKALDAIEQAVRVDPRNAGVWEYRGKLLGLLSRYDEAYASYNHSLELEPTRAHVYLTRSDTEVAQGRDDDALADLRRYPRDGKDFEEAQHKIVAITSIPPRLTVAVGDLGQSAERERALADQIKKEKADEARAAAEREARDRTIQEAQQRAEKAEADAAALRALNEAHDREKRAEAEKQRVADEATAKARKEAADEELRKQAAAEALRKAEAQRREEAEPINVLTRAYTAYIVVKRCHEKRDGYASVYINDGEIERARAEIKRVSTKLKEQAEVDTRKAVPEIVKDEKPAQFVWNDDGAWRAGNERADRLSLDDTVCHQALAHVDAAFKSADPEAAMTKKDF